MKMLYVVPETNIIGVSMCNILTTSGEKVMPKEFSESTLCPFNHEWCRAKQERLSAWRNVVERAAKNKSNHVFHTAADMFCGCPYSYKDLCAGYEQKQR